MDMGCTDRQARLRAHPQAHGPKGSRAHGLTGSRTHGITGPRALSSCCTQRLFYKPYKKPLAKNFRQELMPRRTYATKNFCHGNEHVSKVFLSICCTRRLFYKPRRKPLAKNLYQKNLPPRTCAADMNMSPKFSYQAAAREGSSTNIARNL